MWRTHLNFLFWNVARENHDFKGRPVGGRSLNNTFQLYDSSTKHTFGELLMGLFSPAPDQHL